MTYEQIFENEQFKFDIEDIFEDNITEKQLVVSKSPNCRKLKINTIPLELQYIIQEFAVRDKDEYKMLKEINNDWEYFLSNIIWDISFNEQKLFEKQHNEEMDKLQYYLDNRYEEDEYEKEYWS